MSKGRDRTVSRRPDGTWENKRNDAERASSLHKTQKEAEQAAKAMLRNQGGGELTTKGGRGRQDSQQGHHCAGQGPQPAEGQGTLIGIGDVRMIQNTSTFTAGGS